jgi:hypothetical protein
MDQGFFARGRLRAARDVRDQFVDAWVPATLPEVTVLMPIFQQERFVAEAVTSILEQRDIACEILICDDNSSDRSFARALGAISDFLKQSTPSLQLEHTIRVRRNTATRGRMNLHMMAAEASTPILVQAHGDDLSHVGRMRHIADAFAISSVTFVASAMQIMNENGEIDPGATINAPDGPIGALTALSRPGWMIGAGEAWRASLLTDGVPLEMEYAPVAHDRIFGLRAALRGGAVSISLPLVTRRIHDGQWFRHLSDNSSLATRAHGLALQQTMIFGTMLDEIAAATAAGSITSSEARQYRSYCEEQLKACNRELRKHAGQLIGDGRRLVWK